MRPPSIKTLAIDGSFQHKQRPEVVVHVAGRLTDEVLSFVGPATRSLAAHRLDQAVITFDDYRYRSNALQLDGRAALYLIPATDNPLMRWRSLSNMCERVFQERQPHTVHLHGFVPGLVAARILRKTRHAPAVFFSPHASRSLDRLRIAATLIPRAQPTGEQVALVNVADEATSLRHYKRVDLIESPVTDCFFQTPRAESTIPTILATGRTTNDVAPMTFAQLAVLAGSGDEDVSFAWAGHVDQENSRLLTAARATITHALDDATLARQLATAWIYFAGKPAKGFPIRLAQAMAAGVCCVAFDCIQHRNLIRQGESGVLFRNQRELVQAVVDLIDDRNRRLRLGQTARKIAHGRFQTATFEQRLHGAYAERENSKILSSAANASEDRA